MYSFSWEIFSPISGQPARTITAADYSLAVAEARGFHADLSWSWMLACRKLSGIRRLLGTLWKQVRSYVEFYSHPAQEGLQAAADVAVVVDDLDPSDDDDLMARHNIPFKVLFLELAVGRYEGVDVVVVFAKPAASNGDSTRQHLASQGKPSWWWMHRVIIAFWFPIKRRISWANVSGSDTGSESSSTFPLPTAYDTACSFNWTAA